ncbi:hypothetical protein [Micromonospora sp. WMMD987]|uniref:hypothetical protein n=1 Tax=Micromonospora sp. WMMD987 TaxID=3016089 RepID=UPI00249BC194|nr:hypothetical protein [Micromonospora sp. WMMD987]WFE92737.1 hypothetical protein O7612_14945 [Micromonospora sp. WMMD987]
MMLRQAPFRVELRLISAPTAAEAALVIRHTINDWYTNAEGRGSMDSRHDWENDDQPDRTPDVWLDRLPRTNRVPPARAARGSSNPRGTLNNGRRSTPAPRELADAARVLKARMPGIKDKTIVRHLQQSLGWSGLSAEKIRKALSDHPAQPEKRPARGGSAPARAVAPQRRKPQTNGPITIITAPKATRKPAKTAKPARQQPSLAEVVREVRAQIPGIGIRKLTSKVRSRGWPNATAQQVQAVLQKSQPARTPRRPLKPLPSPAERMTHPGACFACGVVPSLLGTCRCS